MTVDAKLLPCPFCGGPASFGTVKYSPKHVQEQGWNQDAFHFVSCIKCGVSNCGIVGHDTMILAAELWNHRELIERREADAPVTAREEEPTYGTEREAFDFARRVYKETGVTPDLRRVYDFYKKALNEPQPGETVAEALKLAAARAEIERLTKENADLIAGIKVGADLHTKAEAERDAKAKWLGELLAVIHRDGGHYQSRHGDEKAVDEAYMIVARLMAGRDLAVAAAFEVAAHLIECDGDALGGKSGAAKAIRALTPDDAQAALEADGREAMRKGVQRVIDRLRHEGQINPSLTYADAIEWAEYVLNEMETLK